MFTPVLSVHIETRPVQLLRHLLEVSLVTILNCGPGSWTGSSVSI